MARRQDKGTGLEESQADRPANSCSPARYCDIRCPINLGPIAFLFFFFFWFLLVSG